MKAFLSVGAMAALLFVAGCLPPASINGIYTEETIMPAPDLVGVWGDPEESEEAFQFDISAVDDSSYLATATNGQGIEFTLEVYATDLNGETYVDFYPDEYTPEIEEFFLSHLLPMHTFYKMEVHNDTMYLWALDGDWVQEMLERDPESFAYLDVDNRIIFTGSSDEVRRFITIYATEADAFSEPLALVRMPEEQ